MQENTPNKRLSWVFDAIPLKSKNQKWPPPYLPKITTRTQKTGTSSSKCKTNTNKQYKFKEGCAKCTWKLIPHQIPHIWIKAHPKLRTNTSKCEKTPRWISSCVWNILHHQTCQYPPPKINWPLTRSAVAKLCQGPWVRGITRIFQQ